MLWSSVASNGTGTGIAFANTNDPGNIGASIIFNRTGSQSQGELQFYTKQSTTLGVAPVLAMLISNTGNVNIGTQSSSLTPYKLYVSTYDTATAAATIENTSALSGTQARVCASSNSLCNIGLTVKLGAPGSATSPGGDARFIQFMKGNGLIIGKFQGDGDDTLSYTSNGADYGEYFRKENPSETTQTGELMCLGPTGGVTRCTSSSTSIVGVVSRQSIVVGNGQAEFENNPGYVIIGLTGQVSMKVSTINGAIKNGDALTSSPFPGVAMKATKEGEIVGRAIGSYNEPNSSTVGEISTYVSRTWYDPDVYITSTGNINILEGNNNSAPTFTLKNESGQTVTRTGIFSDAVAGNLRTGQIQTNNLDVQSLTLGGSSLNDKLLGLESMASVSAGLSNPLTILQSQVLSLSDRVASLEARLTASNSASLFANSSLGGFTASSGAELNLDKLNVNSSIIADSINVLSYATVNDLSVTGNITAGLLQIKGLQNGGASISTLNGDLKLQDQGFGGLDILNGKVTVDTLGNVNVTESLTAKKYNVDTTNTLSASAGMVTIPTGGTSTDVTSTALTSTSLIFVTPNKPVVVGAEKKDFDTFTIKLQSPAATNIKVNWWIVN